MIRAKFKCWQVKKFNESESVILHAVTTGSVENEQWAKYTPGGNLNMVISNPVAQGKFEEGKEYYLDITPTE